MKKILKIFVEKFGGFKNYSYLCIRFKKGMKNARKNL
jgi:hypothetical protein